MGQLHMEIVPRQLSDEIPHLPRLGLRTFEAKTAPKLGSRQDVHLCLNGARAQN